MTIDVLTIFAWFVLVVVFLVFVSLIVAIGSLPKKIADKRNHPQAEAINAASWIGLLVGGVGWGVAFVWAFTRAGSIGYDPTADSTQSPEATEGVENELVRLRTRVAELETALAKTAS